MTRPEHDHLLDGVLHDAAGCAMCIEIRRRIELAKVDQSVDRALAGYREIASRPHEHEPFVDRLVDEADAFEHPQSAYVADRHVEPEP